MSDPAGGTEIDPLSLQRGDQHGSHNDGGHAKSDAAPTLAPYPVSVLQGRKPESLDDEIQGRARGKEHLEDDQKEFANGHVGETPVERRKREDFVKNDVGGEQQ